MKAVGSTNHHPTTPWSSGKTTKNCLMRCAGGVQMAEQQDRPLWEVMHEAYWRVAGCNGFNPPASPDCYAAEIRAIVDRVLPEEPITPMLPDGYNVTRAKWEQRMATRALLLAEAERAERAG